MNIEILILLLMFQAKHLIADYYLQFPYMYMNKGKTNGWKLPLFDHSGIHAIFTLVIVGVATANPLLAFLAMLFDFGTHFVTDRWKAIKKDGPDTSKFWYSLGIDQMVHHIVGIIIVYWITQG